MAFGLPNVSFIGYPAPLPCAGHAGLGFREARPRDAQAMRAHFAGLSAEDRRMRFCASLSGAALDAHVASMWTTASLVIAGHDGPLWSGPFHRAGPVRALAEVIVDGRDSEIGLSVDGALRRLGVGVLLVQTAAWLLAPRGVTRLHAYTTPGNIPMLRIGRRSGARIETDAEAVEITFDVAELRLAYLRRRMLAPVGLSAVADRAVTRRPALLPWRS